MRYVFDDCTLDTERYELRRASVRIPLRPKVFQLLAYLITHQDRVVLKDKIVEHLWPHQFIGDTALKSCILTARKAGCRASGATICCVRSYTGHTRWQSSSSPWPSPSRMQHSCWGPIMGWASFCTF
jgi:DNA-binding response OmpR family regulator